MRFNINDKVKIKLTDRGHRIGKENHDKLINLIRETGDEKTCRAMEDYNPCVEDGEGWSEWQMWRVMEIFGPHVSIGFDPPFETDMIIID